MAANRVEELTIALCDPRLMREFMFLASLLNLDYSIPSFKGGLQSINKLVLADEECINAYGLKGGSALAVNEANLTRVLIGLLGVPTEVMLVGVDPGKKFAYVVLTGGTVCSRGYVSNFRELLDIINSLTKKLYPKKVIIKVGEQGKDKALELIKLINSDFYELYIVPENKTNTKNPYLVLGRDSLKFNKDFNAALNIALKNGLRISNS